MMEVVIGITSIVKNAGAASEKSSHLIFLTELIMSIPTIMSAGAVAADGMMPAIGANINASMNNMATTTDVRPVRPPSLTPETDSI